jgi:hypothetical protein
MAHPAPNPTRRRLFAPLLAALVAGAIAAARLDALTLDDLLNDPKLTPKRFADYFADFAYEYGEAVQPPEQFLRSRRGDCDDYAVLADFVLKKKGYQTRLVHVRMVGRVAHAVCYVTQSHAYVDYNNRHYFINLQRCGGTIRAIATTVADSFEANWTSASEFTYEYAENKKHFGPTVVKTDPPSLDPDSANP